MVGWLSYGKVKFEPIEPQMRECIPKVHEAMMKLIPLIDADSFAYDRVMKAIQMPKNTPELAAARDKKIQDETKAAAELPLHTCTVANSVWDTLIELAQYGSLNARSDLEIAARALELAVWGAQRNVVINLASVEDKEYVEKLRAESEKAVAYAKEQSQKVLDTLNARKD